MPVNILGVASSMRKNSYSTKTLKIILECAKQHGANTQLLDLNEMILPIYSPNGNDSEEIKKITKNILWANAFVLASPDYHGSMSGAMKNLLDYFWSEFAGKTFGYVCASHEKGLTVMDQMRTAVRQCYGWSLPYGTSVNSDEDFDKNGNITNSKLQTRLDMMARDLTVYGEIIYKQFNSDCGNSNSNTFAAYHRKNA
jgi:NAD(P)H-dependent FMN reductase